MTQTRREIHLDFHNAPELTDIGADFDAAEFARIARDARVTSMNVFAKCHHGYTYYPTKVGTQHPGLSFDLLGEQIAALHSVGIKAPIYISVLWDDLAGQQHPEWIITTRDGRTLMRRPLSADSPNEGTIGWTTLDITGAYCEQLFAMVAELMRRYPVDGFWFDIVWAQPNYSPSGQMRMRAAGVDIADSEAVAQYTSRGVRQFMESMSALIRSRLPEATVFYNCQITPALGDVVGTMSHLEIESLPTSGDQWGYPHFPLLARFARAFERPMLGMTGRFHRSWADFGGLKTVDQLLYECGTIVSAGGGVSVGDQLDPRGRLDAAVYRTIGAAFEHIAEREPWLVGTTPMVEVAILGATAPSMRGERPTVVHSREVEGMAQLLLELGVQFDILDPDRSNYSGYRALFIPTGLDMNEAVLSNIAAARSNGVAIVFAGGATLDADNREFVMPDMPMRYVGPTPTKPSYLRLAQTQVRGELAGDYDYVCYGQAHIVEAQPNVYAAGELKAARFNRSWEHFTGHAHAPVGDSLGAPIVVSGKGVLYFAPPIFVDYLDHDYWVYRELFAQELDRLLGTRLVRVLGPGWIEVTRHRQAALADTPRREVLHFVTYQARRLNKGATVHVDQSAPVSGVSVVISEPEFGFTRATIAPTGEDIPSSRVNGGIRLDLPPIGRHTVVSIE